MKLSTAISRLILLSIPIIIGQIGQMLIGAGDVFIASMHGTSTVAAVGVANGSVNPILLLGLGLMMGISPALAILRGKGKAKGNELSTMIFYALVIGLLSLVITLSYNQLIPYFGLEEEIVPQVMQYNRYIAFSFPFAILFQALKEYLQGYENVMFPNILSLVSAAINIGLNYYLVFGYGSFEGLGAVGLPIASIIIRSFLALFLLVYILNKEKLVKINFELSYDVFKFSIPIGLMFFMEVLAFCVAGVLSGKISVLAAATNNIIITIAATTFMIPLSLGSASAVKVGHALGRKSRKDIVSFIQAGIICMVIYTFVTSAIYFSIPDLLVDIMTDDIEVINLGMRLIFIVAIFQLVDNFQALFIGILRGLKYTKIPTVFVFIAFWIIGIPCGIYMAFNLDFGVSGLWIGLSFGLATMALTLGAYLFIKLQKLDLQNS